MSHEVKLGTWPTEAEVNEWIGRNCEGTHMLNYQWFEMDHEISEMLLISVIFQHEHDAVGFATRFGP